MVRVDSLRKRLYDMWVKNPYLTAKNTCEKLKNAEEDLDRYYDCHGSYINKLLSEFRSYYSFGSPQEAHLFPEHRIFEWERVPRDLLPGEGGFEARLIAWGWKRVVNRNDVWSFRDPLGQGSVHWYEAKEKGGLVRLFLKGELQLAKAKELFCRAFRWFDANDLRKYLDVPLVEKYRKWTFEMGQPVPRFDIRQFERSHGLRIFSDGSHPTSWHVGESIPFWLDEQRQATKELGVVVREFGYDIKEHLKLITGAQEFVKEIYEEAREWRIERKSVQSKVMKRKEKHIAPSQKTIFEWLL